MIWPPEPALRVQRAIAVDHSFAWDFLLEVCSIDDLITHDCAGEPLVEGGGHIGDGLSHFSEEIGGRNWYRHDVTMERSD